MRVLLIEDHKPLVRALRQAMGQEGFTVDVAEEGEEADAKARGAEYDAIILDATLPRIDGLTLLRGWRRAGITTHVLLLTARGGTDAKVRGLDTGADDHLTKPLELEVLLTRLHALSRHGNKTDDPIIRVSDLEIDTSSRTVRRKGQHIQLTPREYALLELLAHRRGRVTTRPMIWGHLYDEQDECSSNVIAVYIRYLRNKIDKGFESPLIVTRWGQGYMLKDEG